MCKQRTASGATVTIPRCPSLQGGETLARPEGRDGGCPARPVGFLCGEGGGVGEQEAKSLREGTSWAAPASPVDSLTGPQ